MTENRQQAYVPGPTIPSIFSETSMRATELLPDHLNESNFNGITVRKGTVGAFIVNVRIITNPVSTAQEKAAAFNDIEDAIPAFNALGLFEILEVRDPHIRSFIADRMGRRLKRE
jgi:hypothetical protein